VRARVRKLLDFVQMRNRVISHRHNSFSRS
jgi:hypothetical protein